MSFTNEAEMRTGRVNKNQEDFYYQLLMRLPGAVYTCDAEGYITFYNNAAATLWGREPEAGKDLWCGSWKIYYPDDSHMPLDECPMVRTLKEGRAILNQEIIVEHPDGEKRNILPHPQPIFNSSGKLIGAMNMLMDITEKKITQDENEKKYQALAASLERKMEERTEELNRKNKQLLDSETRFHKMIEEVEDYAILLLDKNGIIETWNKGAEKIKGYNEGEIVGKHFSIFYLPEDRKNHLPERLMNEAASA